VQGHDTERSSEQDVTVFKNIGGAHQDVFATAILKDSIGL
jgi:ornithine cyclodeaminase/alanine dehydrogenase-like protein (mu-crystallin family)